jgi:hypothetical protein
MKKTILILLFSAIACASLSGMDKTSSSSPSAPETPGFHGWKKTVPALFLFLSGSWLAHKQLPRLAGQEIYYNAPQFTKGLALLFFTIGISGAITGAIQLAMQLHDNVNKSFD